MTLALAPGGGTAAPSPAALTVKGTPITATQIGCARGLLAQAKALNAPGLAQQACIFAAIMESSLGTALGWNASNPTFGGPLAGNIQYFGQLGGSGSNPVLNAQAKSFFQGGNGFQANGAIAASGQYSDPALLAAAVEAPFDAYDPPPYGQYIKQGGIALINQVKAEAVAIVAAYGSGNLPGGVFGLGGTGAPGNAAAQSLWQVGSPSNPHQDYWTTINQYSMDSNWYCFSDGETLFVADGVELMAQQPQAIINRFDPAVLEATVVYDNTAFTYSSTHRRKGRTQRRSSLTKVTSPTEVTIRIVCDIDQFRAGDTVLLRAWGPASGIWLIGNTHRSIFSPFTELTLVQAMQPINAVTGLQTGPAYQTGPAAGAPGSGSVIAAMVTEAANINNSNYPYVWGGGHAVAGRPDIGKPGGKGYDGHTIGFDCSGAVGAVLVAGGLLTPGASVASSTGIVDGLIAANKVQPGTGTGTPACTLYDSPQHIFMSLNNTGRSEFFGTADGAGHTGATSNQGAGWIPNGSAGSGYRVTHIPQSILGQRTLI